MKKNIKYALSLIALLVLFIGVGNISMAEKSNEIIEPVVIEAKDIGIKEINEEAINDDSEVETKDTDAPIQNVQDMETEKPKDESEIESSPTPKGMYEGYEEGIYFEPNTKACEIHEECYICEKCEIESEYFYDEDINPNGGWVYDEYCVVCGHGTCTPVSEKEVQ